MYNVSCPCGQLRISFESAPAAQLVCHCSDCRSMSGFPFTEVVFFKGHLEQASGAFAVTELKGGSGKPKRYHRCVSCNGFAFAQVDALRGMLGVSAQSISPPFAFQPMAHVWTSQKLEEVHIPSGVFQFEKGPPSRPGA